MNISDETLANRTPVWEVLSELFLDNELDENDLSRIANTLKKSPYTISELEIILNDEVYPVCIYNLLNVAGEWAGFDSDWLKESILKRKRRKFFRLKSMRINRWMIKKEWNKIKSLITCGNFDSM